MYDLDNDINRLVTMATTISSTHNSYESWLPLYLLALLLEVKINLATKLFKEHEMLLENHDFFQLIKIIVRFWLRKKSEVSWSLLVSSVMESLESCVHLFHFENVLLLRRKMFSELLFPLLHSCCPCQPTSLNHH